MLVRKRTCRTPLVQLRPGRAAALPALTGRVNRVRSTTRCSVLDEGAWAQLVENP